MRANYLCIIFVSKKLSKYFATTKKHPKLKGCSFAEGRTRTGTWGEPRWILSPLRLPISPLRLINLKSSRMFQHKNSKINKNFKQDNVMQKC